MRPTATHSACQSPCHPFSWWAWEKAFSIILTRPLKKKKRCAAGTLRPGDERMLKFVVCSLLCMSSTAYAFASGGSAVLMHKPAVPSAGLRFDCLGITREYPHVGMDCMKRSRTLCRHATPVFAGQGQNEGGDASALVTHYKSIFLVVFSVWVCVSVCLCVFVYVFVETNWQTLCIVTTKEIISMKIQGMLGSLRRVILFWWT